MALGSFSNGLGFGVAFSLINDFSQTAREIENEMRRLSGVTDSFANSIIASMGRIRIGVGLVIASIIGLGFFVKAAKVDATFQNYEVALQAFLGSAKEAQRVFEQVKQDAIANPKFSIDAFEKANVLLIAQGVAADKAMRTVRDLGTILLGVGGGATELNNVSAALEKVKATGYLTGQVMRSFISARLPLTQMLHDIGIAFDPSRPSKYKITFEQLTEAMHVATLKGHLFGSVWGLMTNNISAKAAQLAENFTAAMGNIGKAIESVTIFILDKLGKIVTAIYNFTNTPLGAWTMRIALAITLLTFGFGVLLIAMNIGRVTVAMLAKTFTGATRAMIMTTLAEKGVVAATWQMVKAIGAALIELWPIIVVGALIAGAIYLVNRSFKEFDAVMSGAAKPVGGFVGWLQKLGGILRFIGELFSGWDEKTQTFLVSTKMLRTLNELGILKFALNIATWIARLESFWTGLKQGFSEAWNYMKDGFTAFSNVMDIVFNKVGILGALIGATESKMSHWAVVGKAVAYILMGVFAALTILAVTSAVSMIAAYWPFYLTVLAIVAAILYLKKVWDDFDDDIHGRGKAGGDKVNNKALTPEQQKQREAQSKFFDGSLLNTFGNQQRPNALQYPGFDNRRYNQNINAPATPAAQAFASSLGLYDLLNGYSPISKSGSVKEASNLQITLINKMDSKEISRTVYDNIVKDSTTKYH